MGDKILKSMIAIAGTCFLLSSFLKTWNAVQKYYEKKENDERIRKEKEELEIQRRKENAQAIIREVKRKRKEETFDIDRFAIECNAYVVKKEREEERLERENKTNV